MKLNRFNFRAWNIKEKEMITPCNGDFIKWHSPSNYQDFYVVMQSLNIVDKNGTVIFEGDILENEFLRYEVVWCASKYYTGWKKRSGDIYTDISPESTSRLVIIGNVYENPELLKDE